MKASVILTSLFLAMVQITFAQEIDREVFKSEIDAIYLSAKQGFKDTKVGEPAAQPDGNSRLDCTIKLNGSLEAYITVDSEKSKSYFAKYEFKTPALAEAALENLIALTLDATEKYGLVRGKGTEIRYVKYQKQTVEFPSDNIDIMGRYPSFSFGIVKDSNPAQIEVMVNEPLWK